VTVWSGNRQFDQLAPLFVPVDALNDNNHVVGCSSPCRHWRSSRKRIGFRQPKNGLLLGFRDDGGR